MEGVEMELEDRNEDPFIPTREAAEQFSQGIRLATEVLTKAGVKVCMLDGLAYSRIRILCDSPKGIPVVLTALVEAGFQVYSIDSKCTNSNLDVVVFALLPAETKA